MNANAREMDTPARPAPSGAGAAALPPELVRLLADDAEDSLRLPARLAPVRLLRGLWLRRRLVAGLWMAVAAAALAVALFAVTRHWESVATLILRQDPDELSIGSGKPYRVADYGLETFLDTLLLPSSLEAALARAGIEAAPTTLAGAIDVSIARNSNVMNLKVLWDDPGVSAALANALAHVFVEKTRSIRAEQAEEDYDRYVAQLVEARERVKTADRAVLEFQQANQVSDFDAETKARLIDLSRIQAEYRTSVAEVEAMRTAQKELEVAVTTEPEVLVSTTLYRNPLRKRLEEYRWELKEARGRYTAKNPKVVKLEREIAALEQVLNEHGGDTAPESTHGVNGLRQDMQLRLHELNDEIRLAEGRSHGLAESVAEIQGKLAYLSAREKEFAAIRASQESARLLEAGLAAKVEEARVAASAGESPFMVLETARPPQLPAPSGRKLILAAGLVLGLGLGLCVALALEIIDPWMRDRADAQSISPDAVCTEFDGPGSRRIGRPRGEADHALAWRRLVNGIEQDVGGGLLAVVPAPGASATDTAWNVAATLAMKGHPTRLVDALGEEQAPGGPGLVDLLNGEGSLERALQPTPIPRLSILPTGNVSAAEPLWLGSPEMNGLARSFRELAGPTVFSVPSVIADETALEFAGCVGAAVVVARSGETARAAASETIALLEGRGVRTLAIVVTDVPAQRLTTKRANTRDRAQPVRLHGVQHA